MVQAAIHEYDEYEFDCDIEEEIARFKRAHDREMKLAIKRRWLTERERRILRDAHQAGASMQRGSVCGRIDFEENIAYIMQMCDANMQRLAIRMYEHYT